MGVAGFIVNDEAALLVNILGNTCAAIIGNAAAQVDALGLVLFTVGGKPLLLIGVEGAVKTEICHILGQPFGVSVQVHVDALQKQAGAVGQAGHIEIFLRLGQVDADAHHQAVPVGRDFAKDAHDLFSVQQQVVGPFNLAVNAITLL